MNESKDTLPKEVSVKLKNFEKLISEKNRELEIKNKDLAIESSLERVRTVSMSMKKPEDLLNICEALFQELHTLGFRELRNVMVNIYDDENETFLNYDYSDVIGKSITKLAYNINPIIKKQIQQVRIKRNVYSETYFSIDDLKEWKKFRKKYGEKDDPRLNKAKELYYHFYSVGTAAIGISCFDKILKDQKSILKRFRNVFDLAYGKYSDVTLAEAQAREAQIELSLERVRARTLAMHSSSELQDAAILLFEQIRELGVNTGSCGFVIWENEKKDATFRMSSQDGSFQEPFTMPHTKTFIYKKIYSAKESGKNFFELKVSGDKLKKHFDYLTTIPGIGEKIKGLRKARFKFPETMVYNCAFFKQGYLSFHTHESYPEAHEIFKRFAKIFEQTYTRFLDLQKAEAQTREAQIENALEKVRSHSMGMQSSEDLAGVATVMFDQLRLLGGDLFSCGIVLCDKNKNEVEQWHSVPGAGMLPSFFVPVKLDQIHQYRYDQWKEGVELFSIVIAEDKIAKHFDLMMTLPSMKAVMDGVAEKGLTQPVWPSWEIDYGASFRYGYLLISALTPFEENKVLPRFAKVFEQTYTRFLDLQKAETQAREGQIEAALERVRSRSMGMQNSEELKDIIKVVYDQFVQLNINVEHAGFIIDYKKNDDMHIWLADTQEVPLEITIPYFDSPHWNSFIEAKKKGNTFFTNLLSFKVKNKFYKDLFKLIPDIPEEVKDIYFKCPGLAISTVLLDDVGLYIENFSGVPYTDKENDILKRFGKVFQQTYTRFNDLKQAEAQVKEAKIEASLERVRSRAMAMHKSDELLEVGALLYSELSKLGIEKLTSGYVLINEDEKMSWNYGVNPADGNIRPSPTGMKLMGNDVLKSIYASWKKQEPVFVIKLNPKETIKHQTYIAEKTINFPFSKEKLLSISPKELIVHTFNFRQGYLLIVGAVLLTKEQQEMIARFAKVFEMTYRRFLDLQQSEAQERESQIEASLERVRSQTMAMSKSQDLEQVVSVIFKEMDNLDPETLRCGIGIINGESRCVNVYTTTNTDDGFDVNISGNESMDVHPLLKGAFNAWHRQEDFNYTLEGEDLIQYYETISEENYKLPESASGAGFSEMDRQYYYCTFFSEGGLFFLSKSKFSEDLIKVLKRFANAFSLAYKRFEDLKQSEARALEAIKESSLDRVRAEISSMRSTEDLNRITPLIWRELTTLKVSFFRCGVFIIDEIKKEVEVHLSSPNGNSLGAMNLPFDSNKLTSNSVDHWRKDLVYTEHWNKDEFLSWMNSMKSQGMITDVITYQDTTTPPESLDLHFVPFIQGMIYVGNDKPLTKENIDLVKSLADAFSIAYARYEDFRNLEKAKQNIETTLAELKATQSQLIQSEKMASLGELTAGIAHEIQNPLNFVNNFSEVNTELIDELNEELGKGNYEDAKDLARDIKDNEEKIKHHGKRAEAIVKGMLQHSRTSSGVKESTNINVLADEYLRLAYHGLRAKDKTFNAKMETDFDESIGSINIISQDIGRVILNLITNAFYVVDEKKKKHPEEFEPVVKITTKKIDNNVKISVKDNGNGIPQNVLEKIFQPFFTTKPTGQGTGLGLSLSYDIVKAHGGVLKVETKECEGSEFVIELPLN